MTRKPTRLERKVAKLDPHHGTPPDLCHDCWKVDTLQLLSTELQALRRGVKRLRQTSWDYGYQDACNDILALIEGRLH